MFPNMPCQLDRSVFDSQSIFFSTNVKIPGKYGCVLRWEAYITCKDGSRREEKESGTKQGIEIGGGTQTEIFVQGEEIAKRTNTIGHTSVTFLFDEREGS
jgi:hypothetical protein